MTTLYRQEMFKLLKRRSTVFFAILLAVQNIGFGWLGQAYAKYTQPKEFFAASYGTPAVIVFVMIAACASIVSSEFEYNTMKNLFSQAYSRATILMSKWLAMLTYSLGLYLWALGLTMVNHLIWSGAAFSLTSRVKTGSQLWQYWLLNTGASFLSLWLILSVVFLLAAMFKKGLLATLVGIVGYFALGVIGRIMTLLIDKWEFLKWNPLNFLNYPGQVTKLISSQLTHLSDDQLLLGNLAYILVFLGLGLVFFSRKEV